MNKQQIQDTKKLLDYLASCDDSYEYYNKISSKGLLYSIHGEWCRFNDWLDEEDIKPIFEYFNKYSDVVFENVDRFGGEGQGNEYWVVFKCEDTYFRNMTSYASYCGIEEWYGTEEVKAEETIKVVYKKV